MPPLPPASLAWYAVGRFWTVPNHDELAFDAGYFLHLGPIRSLFTPAGARAPGSAHFTFCAAPFAVQTVEDSAPKVSVDTASDFSLYFQREPRGDLGDPASFAAGTRIARFRRPFAVVGEAIALIDAQTFEHDGRTWDLGELLPHGVTQWGVGLTLPATGTGPSATFAGSAIAIGAGPRG